MATKKPHMTSIYNESTWAQENVRADPFPIAKTSSSLPSFEGKNNMI